MATPVDGEIADLVDQQAGHGEDLEPFVQAPLGHRPDERSDQAAGGGEERAIAAVEQTVCGRFLFGLAPEWSAITHPIPAIWCRHQRNSTVGTAATQAWPLRLSNHDAAFSEAARRRRRQSF
jgi:hypothetical protein